jgi:cryptochrome
MIALICFQITHFLFFCFLQFGCLSCRLFYQKLQAVYSKSKKYSKPPVSLEGQVILNLLSWGLSQVWVMLQLLIIAISYEYVTCVLWGGFKGTYLCPAVWQLLWREFFYTAGYGTPNFDRMYGNPICKQVRISDFEFLDLKNL